MGWRRVIKVGFPLASSSIGVSQSAVFCSSERALSHIVCIFPDDDLIEGNGSSYSWIK